MIIRAIQFVTIPVFAVVVFGFSILVIVATCVFVLVALAMVVVLLGAAWAFDRITK